MPPELIETLSVVSLTIGAFVTLLFLISIPLKRNDIADTAWGIGVCLAGLSAYLFLGSGGIVPHLVLGMALLWGIRLSVRIFLRNRRKGEDFRYRTWRETWGKFFLLRSYGQIYLLQGLLMIIVGYPLVHTVVFGSGAEVTFVTAIGILIWCVGFFFEVVGDYQLDRSIQTPHEQSAVMSSGLWKYTRHPNYFGEVTMWWGIGVILLTIPYGYFALVGPLTITFLILKVSGIPMLEKKFADNPQFQLYACRTSAFFPLPQRSCGNETHTHV